MSYVYRGKIEGLYGHAATLKAGTDGVCLACFYTVGLDTYKYLTSDWYAFDVYDFFNVSGTNPTALAMLTVLQYTDKFQEMLRNKANQFCRRDLRYIVEKGDVDRAFYYLVVSR